MRSAWPLLALAGLLLSGCSSPPSSDAPASDTPIQYQDPSIAVQAPDALPRDPPAAGERTLDAVPQWRLGEWWTYRVVDHFQNDRVLEVTRVVAGSEAGSYLVGFPVDAFSNDVLIFHVPGYGDISKEDLSFEVHDQVFAPLRFPLSSTATWPTKFEGRLGNVSAEPTADGKATLSGSGVGWSFTGTYDPALGELSSFDYPGYASYEVTGHGYGYQGVVRVPHSHDLIFFNGRQGGVLPINGPLLPPSPRAPTETVDVASGYDHLAFVIILGGILPTPASAPSGGYFDEKVTAPNGTVYELSMMPEEPGLKIQFYGTGDPTGTWTLEHVAAGAGLAFVEGIGYHSIDVDLPSGCVIQSVNAQHHGIACKVVKDVPPV